MRLLPLVLANLLFASLGHADSGMSLRGFYETQFENNTLAERPTFAEFEADLAREGIDPNLLAPIEIEGITLSGPAPRLVLRDRAKALSTEQQLFVAVRLGLDYTVSVSALYLQKRNGKPTFQIDFEAGPLFHFSELSLGAGYHPGGKMVYAGGRLSRLTFFDPFGTSRNDGISHRLGVGIEVGLLKPLGKKERLSLFANYGLMFTKTATRPVQYFYGEAGVALKLKGWRR